MANRIIVGEAYCFRVARKFSREGGVCTYFEEYFVVAQEKLVMIKLWARITWISRFLLTATVKFM